MPEQTPTRKISILSYNLYCLPWVACMMKPSTCPYSLERATAFLNYIHSYDIIALQELWSPRYQQVEAFAKQNGFYVVGSAQAPLQSMLGLRVFGGGLMILSKYPIELSRELIFDKGVSSDGFVRKGILYAKVRVGSAYVHIFNTHMQASYGFEFDPKDPYALIRKKQIQQVSDFVAQMALDDNHPILMMGDFNVNAISRPEDPSSDSNEYKEMTHTLSRHGLFTVLDVHKSLNRGTHPVTNTGRGVVGKPSKGGQRLDFVLELLRNTTRKDRIFHAFSKAEVLPFEVEGGLFTNISDHYASHAIMEIRPKNEPSLVDDEADGIRSMVTSMTVQLTA